MGRATTTVVNLTQYDVKNGNQLTFEVRATDPAGNVGKSAKATPIVVDTTAPVPSRFTQISLTGVNDGKLHIIHAGKGVCALFGKGIVARACITRNRRGKSV